MDKNGLGLIRNAEYTERCEYCYADLDVMVITELDGDYLGDCA